MSTEIRRSELRNDNAAVMRRVAAGETFVVTVNGRPVADVIPHRETGRCRFVPAADAIAALTASPLSAEDAQRWWHDIREGGHEQSGPDVPEDPWTPPTPMSSGPRRALLDTSVVIAPPTASRVRGYADELAVSVIRSGSCSTASRR